MSAVSKFNVTRAVIQYDWFSINPTLQGFAPKLAKWEIASLSGAADDRKFEDVVKSAQDAAVLVLVY